MEVVAYEDGEVLVRMKITNEVECCCCDTRVPEIVDHLFIQCSMSKSVWKLFAEAAGIQRTLIHLRQVIDSWWNATCCSKLKSLLKAIDSFIIWSIWKRKNVIRNGGSTSKHALILGVNRMIHLLVKVRYP